eukprot:2311204-Amphidinium_carterae.2
MIAFHCKVCNRIGERRACAARGCVEQGLWPAFQLNAQTMSKRRQALMLASASSSPTCAGYGRGALHRELVTSAWSESPIGNRTTLTQLCSIDF